MVFNHLLFEVLIRKLIFFYAAYVQTMSSSMCFDFSLISRMLVREPSKRASLESIYNDPWLKSGMDEEEEEETSVPPLISEIRVTPDLHLSVLQKMESGNIAKREEIKRYD